LRQSARTTLTRVVRQARRPAAVAAALLTATLLTLVVAAVAPPACPAWPANGLLETTEARRSIVREYRITPPEPKPYRVPGTDVAREAKRVACRVAEAVTTHERWTRADEIGREAAGSDGARRRARARAAAPLHRPYSWSRGVVVYPQLGGLRGDRASVMVVVRREIGVGPRVERTETRTLDVRLVRENGSWRFDSLASVGGSPVSRPSTLSRAAAAVVDDPRIELPDTARWDIYRGLVSPRLLRLMARMADRGPYGVTVLRTGHPPQVFGTDRMSQHTVGEAVDLYRVVGRDVCESRGEGSAARGLVHWLLTRQELSQLGSPWTLDAGGARSFSDAVHQDHLHIAVGG
jgi:hypothetical protein